MSEKLESRVRELEEAVTDLHTAVKHLNQVLKEAQGIIVKIATSQQQVVDRVKTWPYVVIDKDDDSNT